MVVIHVKLHPDAYLSKVVQALDYPGLFLGPAQRRQEHARKDHDNGYHDQQFNQRETTALQYVLSHIDLQTNRPLINRNTVIEKLQYLCRECDQSSELASKPQGRPTPALAGN